MSLFFIGLAGFLVLPQISLATDTKAEESGARAGAITADVGSHLEAGNLAGIYGERRHSDDAGVSGNGAIGTKADANLPGRQLPLSFRTSSQAPPQPGGISTPDRSAYGYLGRVGGYVAAARDTIHDWRSPPVGKLVENPGFTRTICAGGQLPPCPMQVMIMGENTPYAAKITDFVNYGEIDGTVFSNRKWWKFWEDGKQVNSGDVHQGGLGDCFLLASLAAIANKEPDIIRKMIRQHRKSEATWINFYEGTPSKPVFVGPVDNEFPVFKSGVKRGSTDLGGQSAFAKPVGDPPPPIWPLIIEKAYAIKFRDGSYGELNTGGLPSDAMTHITGRPSHFFVLDPGSPLFVAPVDFSEMARWDANGQPITIGTKGAPKGGCPAAPPAPAESGTGFHPTTESVCTDPLYQGKIACLPGSGDLVCRTPQNQIVKLHTGHAYWVKSVDVANETVTLANPWGSDQPEVVWPWWRLKKSINVVFVNDK